MEIRDRAEEVLETPGARVEKENICVLSGHPATCPPGKPRPKRECCQKYKESIDKGISSLVNLRINQKAKVAHVHTGDHKKLQKLMAMGVLPGMSISLIQKFPSYVFQIGQSQFAVDKALAECIFAS
jgi:DtxR family Mn-dependent transcriptional regulator